ncbi:hypothetical protein M427DRAFT_58493 [Gonapodya prolifera JEL478]|uniref:C3H1-type domain-containing protein n=1 Tax=Gonapodya prolifera (strain JEL478) TaxID=1344416 RepID=A0A139AAB3_GONPJ|nr:hypothetical protein M427DRAFT_58493 [Gonapodya prolifera JEL478]|eukprot:KXS13680.1 hypothetical protein M427DRAFT_58493 [Gonapodya prolifera JEL478]
MTAAAQNEERDLLRQIALLEGALEGLGHQSSPSSTSRPNMYLQHNSYHVPSRPFQVNPSAHSTTFHPGGYRPPGRNFTWTSGSATGASIAPSRRAPGGVVPTRHHPYAKAPIMRSRNLKLITTPAKPILSESSGSVMSVPGEAQTETYVSRGNKLVRVGSGTIVPHFTLPIRPQRRRPSSRIPPQTAAAPIPGDSENSTKWIKKRGQIINPAALASVAKSENAKRERLRVGKAHSKELMAVAPGSSVIINGTTYKKSARGNTFVRVGAPIPKPRTVVKGLVISINGLEYIKDPRKKTLKLRTPGDTMTTSTPRGRAQVDHRRGQQKTLRINGELYVRTKSGNLRRVSSKNTRKGGERFCRYYTRFGLCKKPRCRFQHDPQHRALCTRYLRGVCPSPETCTFSHTRTDNNAPLCSHFQTGNCRREDCLYLHSKVGSDAPVCSDFAKLGWCDRGSACPERHVYECPSFSATGACPNAKCKMPHVAKGGSAFGRKRKLGHAPGDDRANATSTFKRLRVAEDGIERCIEAAEDEDLDSLPIRPDFDNILFADLPDFDFDSETDSSEEDDEEEDEDEDDEDEVGSSLDDEDRSDLATEGDGGVDEIGTSGNQGKSDSESPEVEVIGEVSLPDEEDEETPEIIELDVD